MTGPEHRRNHQPNQDALSLRGWSGGWVAAVADGLGSRPFSGEGSRAAVQAAQHVIRVLAERRELRSTAARDIAIAVYRQWLSTTRFTDKSNAATTLLLAACNSDGNVRLWQLGDGLIVCRSQGTFRVITPERSAFGNETRALGIDRAWSYWTSTELALRDENDAIVLMTDGVADDLNVEKIPQFTEALIRHLSTRSRRAGRSWLQRELMNWATPNHTDDKTIAVIYRRRG